MNVLELPETHIKSTTEAWRLELANRLNRFCMVAKQFNLALSNAQEYLSNRTSELSGYSSMQGVVVKWLVDVCNQANKDAHNETHIRLSIENLSSDLRGFDFPRSHGFSSKDKELKSGTRFYDANNEELAQWMVDNFDFDKLEKEMNALKGSLNNRGLQSAAEALGRTLGLIKRGYYNESDLELKMQKGRYLLDMSHYGNWRHERVNSLSSLQANARTFEKESSVVGLTYCLQMAINEENGIHQSYDVFVPSRTKIAEHDSNVSGTFFNSKIRLAFEPEYFEALIGFIREYSKQEIKTIIIK